MTELILVRHSQPHGGVADPGLTPWGLQLAERAAAWLAHDPVDVVVASPMRRAQETAAPIAAALGREVHTLQGLLEWEAVPPRPVYVPLDEFPLDHPARLSLTEGRYPDFVPPFDHQQFRATARAALDEIFDRWPVDRIVAVCHGGVINAMLTAVIEESLGVTDGFFFVYPAYTSMSVVERVAGGRTVLRSINDVGHVMGERIPGAVRPSILEG
jgi:probable phosphoglycerate mutase